jgi:hypothetical protein
MAGATPITGGCLCGAVRFAPMSPPGDVGVCHCRICQKNSGGPHMVWAFFPRQGFSFTQGEPTWYRSSAWGERGFCSACGSPLAFRDATDSLSVPVGALDHPQHWPPTLGHNGMESILPWDVITDDLPRFRTDDNPVIQASMDAAIEDPAGRVPRGRAPQ